MLFNMPSCTGPQGGIDENGKKKKKKNGKEKKREVHVGCIGQGRIEPPSMHVMAPDSRSSLAAILDASDGKRGVRRC